ncbi:MAG: hypothetical protein ABR928_06635 [Terracidiphilus sp.]
MSLLPPGLAAKFVSILALAAAMSAAPARAQYVGQVSKPDGTPEMRAVAVLEWVGDQEHPTRSRIIPVSLFDGQQLQDASIYLAQPQPLALDNEVEYQLKEDGKNTGLFVVYGATEESGSWVGYGKLEPMPKPKPVKSFQTKDWNDDDAASDKPVLHRKHHADDTGTGSSSASSSASSPAGSGNPGEAPDPDRPTLHKGPDASGDSGSGAASNSGSQTATDPDRPTLHKSPNSGDSSTASSGSGSSDPDRPKLNKKNANNSEEPSVSSLNNVDPNRPKLERGHVSYGGGDLSAASTPTLKGLPPEMHQTVAVSDPRNNPEHLWSFSWANPDDEQKYKGQLEDLARTALGLNPPRAPAVTKKTTTTHKKAAAPAAPPEPAPLMDEQFRVFELAYGSGATMVLSAHTAGTGADEKFVTLVAQPDLYGNMAVLLKNTTDGAHLDDTPRLHLIDAVDAMADNRGELLFELRGATGRQFALYRVLRGEIKQLFVSGGGNSSEATN